MVLAPPYFLICIYIQEIKALHTDLVNAQCAVRAAYCTSRSGLHPHVNSYDLQWLALPQCGHWGRHWLLCICSCAPSLFTLQRAAGPLQLAHFLFIFVSVTVFLKKLIDLQELKGPPLSSVHGTRLYSYIYGYK